jgi:Tfp pilus assembly protein PilF/transglutaminase-like putative cysteine protease
LRTRSKSRDGVAIIFFLAFLFRTNDKYRQVMMSHWCASLTVVLAVLLAGRAQTSPPNTPAKDDYSQEAAVIEQTSTRIAFDNDGNSNRAQTSRIRVQTDTGVKEWGLLKFPFQSATQTVEIEYVRVHKADGSTLITPPDNVQDLDAEITRSAPFYSDLREKHVAVKGLGKGDVLEFAAHWHTTKPLIPGHFWSQYTFHHEGIVLDERLEIKVPAERAVKVKGPQATQTVTTEADSRVYAWTYSKLQSAKEPGSDEKKQTESARGLLPAPDVQISSFQNWEEVGRWYWNLQKDRIEPTPAIRAKAAELTKGMTDDAAKLRALYGFVSTQYRYIGIEFGIGRYQPHAADDVLTNNYGDCKDKHTLLASLLQASGIALYPALINSSWKLDPDVPSPAQFDHIIGYLPQGKDKDKDKNAVWLDTTAEVAPFGYIVPRLRDKPALVMSGDNSIQLETTPVDSLLPDTEAFKIDGKLSADGTLQAKIEDTTRGDVEVVIRAAFRQVPQPQWKDLVQRISYAMGYEGTVSEISASKPEAIGDHFHLSYSYNRKDYPDWKSDQRITVPGLPFRMPPVRDDASYPVWLGSPVEAVSDSKVELPQGYTPQTPPNVDLKYDFAEYHASYSQDRGVLIAKRRLLTKLREVPVAEFDDYRSFIKNLQNDVNRYVYMQTSSSGAEGIPTLRRGMPNAPPPKFPAFLRDLRELPESSSQDANRVEADARMALSIGDQSTALSGLKRTVELDPKFTRAWLELAIAYMTSGKSDFALDALRKAIDSDPKQLVARKFYAFLLTGLRRPDAAIDAWREAAKIAPDDPEVNLDLGALLMQQERYAEAVPYLETAAKNDNSPSAQASLGMAYLRAGEKEKAVAAFSKLADLDTEGNYLNDVAYEMANADLKLPLALQYAQKAVRAAEEESQRITLPDLEVKDLAVIFKVAAYWDTLGWVDERMSKLDEAELYLRASWKLTQDGVVAGHLCHLYKREHKDELAVEMCRMAINRMSMSHQLALSQYKTEMDAAQENLNHLTGGAGKSKSTSDGSESVIHERMFKLPRFLQGTESAEFFVLLTSDGRSKTFKAEDVKFISGSDKLKLQGKQLKGIDFKVPAPDDVPTRVVRRGILGCYQYTGCSFVLLDPATVTSLK